MKVVRALLIVIALLSVWMTYDNVLSDDPSIDTLAAQTACTIKKCSKQHGMTRMSKTPLGQTLEYTWEDGVVSVSCHRAYYVFGARVCTVDLAR